MRATPSSATSSSTTSISPLHSASGAGVGNGAGPFLGLYCGRVPAAGEDHSPNFRPDGDAPAPRRTPVIVVFGLKPERIVGAEGRIDAVPEPPSQEQAGLLVEAISSGIEAGGTVVAIVPEWFPPEGLQRLEMARVLLDTERVAIHVTAPAPLAATAPGRLPPRPAPPPPPRRGCPPPGCWPGSWPACPSSCTRSPGSAASPASSGRRPASAS